MKKTGLLLVCCALLFLSACGGQTKGEEEALKASEEFIGFIRPFYEGERENYTFLDAQNQDQTGRDLSGYHGMGQSGRMG